MFAMKLFTVLVCALLCIVGTGYWFFSLVPDLVDRHSTVDLLAAAGGTYGLIIGIGCFFIHIIRTAPPRSNVEKYRVVAEQPAQAPKGAQ